MMHEIQNIALLECYVCIVLVCLLSAGIVVVSRCP